MTFQSPLLLWGSLAAAVPLIIHLWGRRRPRRLLFPSLRLIYAGHEQQRSFSRLRDLLALLLRMLLVIILSLALARPMVDSPTLAFLSSARRSAAIIIDTSASMGLSHGRAGSIQYARQAAQTLIQGLPQDLSPVVFTAGAELRRLDEPGRALSSLQAEDAHGRLIHLLNHAADARVQSPDTQLFVITDMQKTTLRGALAARLTHPPIIVDVGAFKPRNHAITDAVIRSACSLPARPTEVEVQLKLSGDALPARIQAGARVDGRAIPGQSVSLASNTGSARFRCRPPRAGEVAWELYLPEDALRVDDVYRLIEPVRSRLRVMVLAEGASPDALSLALAPGGQVDTNIEVITHRWSSAPANLPDCDVLVLADVPARAPLFDRVRTFLRAGGGVVLFTGVGSSVSEELLSELCGARVRLGATVTAPPGEPLALADLDTSYPALAPFADPTAGDIRRFAFTHRRQIQAAQRARTIAHFSDGAPALVGALDPDRSFLLLNTSLDDTWTDAPSHPAFVPFVHRLCYDVAGPQRRVWPDWFAGQKMRIDMPAAAIGSVSVAGPDGRQSTVPAAARRWCYTPPVVGLYEARWKEGSHLRTARFAVNTNPLESDLRRLSRDELAQRFSTDRLVVVRHDELPAHLPRLAAARVDLAGPLLFLALMVLIAETAITLPRKPAAQSEALRP